MLLIYFCLFLLVIEIAEKLAKGKEKKISSTTVKYLIFSILLYMFGCYIKLVLQIFA